MEQLKIGTVNGDFNFYSGPPPTESQTTKIPTEDKKWLNDIANAVSGATGRADYGASTVVREAIRFYREFYAVRHKILKYRKSVQGMLENLP